MNSFNDLTNFYVIGISYKNADLHTRGKFNLSRAQKIKILEKAKKLGISEILINNTCNRTEIYSFAKNPSVLVNLLCEKSNGNHQTFENLGYIFENTEAINHIFKVGTGLDSQILGDFEIIGQLKNSFNLSKDNHLIGSFMERLTNSVIQASKRIKTETKISSGATSVAYAAVQFIINEVDDVSNKNVLLIGTGKIGRNTCENLVKHTENKKITVINRSKEKAEILGHKFDVLVKDFSEIYSEMEKADIIVLATDADEPLIHNKVLTKQQKLLIIDLTIPSNIQIDSSMKNVKVVNLDDLSKITHNTLSERKRYIPEAKKIIEEIQQEFLQWIHDRRYAPALKALKNKLIEQQNAEIGARKRKNGVAIHDPSLSYDMIQKITGQFAFYLKENPSKANDAMNIFKEVFQLDLQNHE
ncbi:MAG: glutamyl-tRNA reductase [Flavobacteriaceae bacterium]|nr:glutamyl-tRNA reductase [Flavobacteriaceae bacterium]